jgi:triacylglycerol lipase
MLVYPMLDDRTTGTPSTGHYVWPLAANRYGWASLLGSAAANPPAEAVPARATDLSGFPPTFLAVGDIDLFAGEDLAFAQALLAAGVPTELHLYPGAYHGFVLVAAAGCAQAFARDARAALARAFGPRPSDQQGTPS